MQNCTPHHQDKNWSPSGASSVVQLFSFCCLAFSLFSTSWSPTLKSVLNPVLGRRGVTIRERSEIISIICPPRREVDSWQGDGGKRFLLVSTISEDLCHKKRHRLTHRRLGRLRLRWWSIFFCAAPSWMRRKFQLTLIRKDYSYRGTWCRRSPLHLGSALN